MAITLQAKNGYIVPPEGLASPIATPNGGQLTAEQKGQLRDELQAIQDKGKNASDLDVYNLYSTMQQLGAFSGTDTNTDRAALNAQKYFQTMESVIQSTANGKGSNSDTDKAWSSAYDEVAKLVNEAITNGSVTGLSSETSNANYSQYSNAVYGVTSSSQFGPMGTLVGLGEQSAPKPTGTSVGAGAATLANPPPFDTQKAQTQTSTIAAAVNKGMQNGTVDAKLGKAILAQIQIINTPNNGDKIMQIAALNTYVGYVQYNSDGGSAFQAAQKGHP